MKYLFLHGLGQDALSWEPVRAHMVIDMDCPALFFLPGSGLLTYETLYHAFAQYCADIKEPLHLCGLSLGAVMALHYGIEHPEKVESLALIAGQDKMPTGLLTFQNAIFHLMPEKAFVQTGLSKQEVIRLTHSMKALDFSRSLGEIRCPVLLICGEKDRANRDAAERMAVRIPGARLQIIAGARHEVNQDAPEALAQCLTSFYNGISSKL